MPALAVRPLREDERAAWEPLWQGYLTFYQASLAPAVTDATWRRFHDPAEPVFALGAVLDDTLVGIAHCILHRSCWTIGDYCHLQDLFVADAARGQGVARALIAGVYERARAAGAERVHWLTHETNLTARSVYETVADRSGFIQYRKML